MRSRVPCLGLLLAMPLAAQDFAWRIPERGAVSYHRTLKESGARGATKDAAMKAPATARPPRGWLPSLVMPPCLCQSELTADQRAVADEPRDLRDVLRAVAFDLRLRGTTRLRCLRILPFGDLVITGRVETPATDGTQTYTLDVASADPEVRPGESKAELQKFVRPLCKQQANGTLTVTRAFDAAVGVVRSFRAELSLVGQADKDGFHKLVIQDEWDLAAVHENQDADFRKDVAQAIRDGAGFVREQLSDLRRPFMQDQADGARSYGSGRIALALLTLLHAETPPDDPVVVAGFDELRRRVLIDTYSLGVALMAMAARYAPPGEAELVRSGVLAAPAPRVLGAADKELAVEWLRALRENLDTRVDAGYRLRFNYIAGKRFDNSVNQYGLLGLQAATLCQLEVSSSEWRAAATHLLDVQGPANGRDVRLSLSSYRDLATCSTADGKVTRAGAGRVPARGYAYQLPDRPSYGSMTTAGITGLVIARAGMFQTGLAKADVVPKVDLAIQSAFAWLAAEFHVRSNPGFIGKADDNWYYYLYGLERACELTCTAHVQERDWYFEGALQILPQQQANGSFRPERAHVLDATCFAVLFLKKATLPAITGG